MSRFMTDVALDREIAGLEGFARVDLVTRWRQSYKADPPKGISRALLIRAVAYAMQVKAVRGLKRAAKRQLFDDADAAANKKAAIQRPALPPGARLVREWNGVTHRVEVIENGFIWNGAHYRSLSAIARAITGARWSGPRFFGVRPEDAT